MPFTSASKHNAQQSNQSNVDREIVALPQLNAIRSVVTANSFPARCHGKLGAKGAKGVAGEEGEAASEGC